MFDPNDLEFINVYSEEQNEELGIDYLGSSMSDPDNTTQTNTVISPLGEPRTRRQNNVRMASPQVSNKYSPMGVRSIVFNMADGSSYTLAISRSS